MSHILGSPEPVRPSLLRPKVMDERPEAPPAPRPIQGPVDIRSVALTILAVLAVMYTLYFARPVLMPITFAFMLSFLLSPVMVFFERLHFPRSVTAALLLLVLLGASAAAAYRLAGPATEWIERAPQTFEGLRARVSVLTEPVEQVSRATQEVEEAVQVGDRDPGEVEIREPGVSDRLFSSTRALIGGGGLMLVLLYFLLASGDLFLRKLVRVLPTLSDKKRAVEIARGIRISVSRYLFAVTLINAGLGVAIGLAMHLIGLPNPILWGVMAMLVNFVPYIGLLVGMGVVTVVALVSLDSLGQALLAPGAYMAINLLEGWLVTPILLGHRLTLNPVAIFLWILLWGWMWGIVGAVVAVPLLATLKIISDNVEPLTPVGEFLGK